MPSRPKKYKYVFRYFARLAKQQPWEELAKADYEALRAFISGSPKLFEQASVVAKFVRVLKDEVRPGEVAHDSPPKTSA